MQTRVPLIDFSLWFAMMTKPRTTIRKIIHAKSDRQVIFLAALFGIDFVLSQLERKNAGDFLSVPYLLIVGVVGGPVVGIFLMYLIGALLHWTGIRLGGQATAEHLRAAYVWSSLPNLSVILLWLPKLLIFWNEFFKTPPRPESDALMPNLLLGFIFLVIFFVPIVASAWSVILLLVSISEVQQFSLLRTLVSILLSALIIFVPAFFILASLQALGLMSYAH